MNRILIAAAAALALAACSRGGGVGRSEDSRGQGNQAATAKPPAAAGGQQLPANLPDYVKVYPGANIEKVAPNGAQGGVIAFDVTDAPDVVAGFYRKAAEASKLPLTSDTAAGNSHVIMWNDPHGRNLMATVDLKQGKTQVTLLYGASS